MGIQHCIYIHCWYFYLCDIKIRYHQVQTRDRDNSPSVILPNQKIWKLVNAKWNVAKVSSIIRLYVEQPEGWMFRILPIIHPILSDVYWDSIEFGALDLPQKMLCRSRCKDRYKCLFSKRTLYTPHTIGWLSDLCGPRLFAVRAVIGPA